MLSQIDLQVCTQVLGPEHEVESGKDVIDFFGPISATAGHENCPSLCSSIIFSIIVRWNLSTSNIVSQK